MESSTALAPSNVYRTALEIPFYVIAGGFFAVGSFGEEGSTPYVPKTVLDPVKLERRLSL